MAPLTVTFRWRRRAQCLITPAFRCSSATPHSAQIERTPPAERSTTTDIFNRSTTVSPATRRDHRWRDFDAGSGSISGCNFTTNSAGLMGGGGIAVITRSLTITNGTFKYNSSTSEGGGLLVQGARWSSVRNVFKRHGRGRRRRHVYAATLSVVGTTFTSDILASDGGGIYTTVLLDGLRRAFTSNSAMLRDSYGYPAAGGGAICGVNATVVVSSTMFSDNQAPSGGGGAIEQAVSNYANQIGSLTVSGSTFTGNTAEAAGAIQDAITTMTLSNTHISPATAERSTPARSTTVARTGP